MVFVKIFCDSRTFILWFFTAITSEVFLVNFLSSCNLLLQFLLHIGFFWQNCFFPCFKLLDYVDLLSGPGTLLVNGDTTAVKNVHFDSINDQSSFRDSFEYTGAKKNTVVFRNTRLASETIIILVFDIIWQCLLQFCRTLAKYPT